MGLDRLAGDPVQLQQPEVELAGPDLLALYASVAMRVLSVSRKGCPEDNAVPRYGPTRPAATKAACVTGIFSARKISTASA